MKIKTIALLAILILTVTAFSVSEIEAKKHKTHEFTKWWCGRLVALSIRVLYEAVYWLPGREYNDYSKKKVAEMTKKCEEMHRTWIPYMLAARLPPLNKNWGSYEKLRQQLLDAAIDTWTDMCKALVAHPQLRNRKLMIKEVIIPVLKRHCAKMIKTIEMPEKCPEELMKKRICQ